MIRTTVGPARSVPSYKRLEYLDGMRGVSALIVLLYHLGKTGLLPQMVPHGYLVVDLFFVLSGFVLFRGYEVRLSCGMSVRRFLLKRAVRMYPLAALGAVLGLTVMLVRYFVSPAKVGPLDSVLMSGIASMFLIPSFFSGAIEKFGLYPGNGALWSLFFEFVANLVWAKFFVRCRTWVVAVCSGVFWVMLIKAIASNGSADVGWNAVSFLSGFPRVMFGFLAGVLLARSKLVLPKRSGIKVFIILGLLLIAIGIGDDGWWDVFCISVLIPLFVLFGANQDSVCMGERIGSLSYPLYAIHLPLLALGSFLVKIVPAGYDSIVGVGVGAFCVISAWGLLVGFDLPIRKMLQLKLGHM